MIKLINLLESNLNLKAGKIYPKVILELDPKSPFNRTYNILNDKKQEIGNIVFKNIDGVDNVVYSIYIEEKFRGQSYAIPIYVEATKILGNICSGEYNKDGTPTRFVSKEADNIWQRLKEIYLVNKIPIQGNKFRYCLDKKNL